jgi:tetratricopeptide (TPR) repeat protein
VVVDIHRLKYGLVAIFTSFVFIGFSLWFFMENRDFGSRVLLMLSGAALSIGVTLIIVEWVVQIANRNQEQTIQEKARQADVDLLNSIEAGHSNFCVLNAELGKLERWTKAWDEKDANETSLLLINFYGAIEREENSLYVHAKRAMEYVHPGVESKKEAYLYCLRQLRTITNSLATSQNKSETSAQFKKAGGELFLTKLSLMKALEDAVAIDTAIKLNPNDVRFNTAKGFYLSNRCKWDEALQWFDKAIGLDPQYAYAFVGKGDALRNLKRPHEADEAFAKVRDLGAKGICDHL